jgi:hypothetical protein
MGLGWKHGVTLMISRAKTPLLVSPLLARVARMPAGGLSDANALVPEGGFREIRSDHEPPSPDILLRSASLAQRNT